jgi:signal transduction histidine kinase
MHSIEPTVLLISPDAALCSAVRSALERSEPLCHIATVTNFAAARRTVADISPDVIVLQESSLAASQNSPGLSSSPIEDVVAALAGFAPVVVLGQRQAPASLAALIAAGAADFVAGGEPFPAAAACVEKRLQSARKLLSEPFFLSPALSVGEVPLLENFGELLRHELNNPLTGILGNAELLLAEARRQQGGPFSEAGVKRLETIAALAVRMRETVRRLSQSCEARSEQDRSS